MTGGNAEQTSTRAPETVYSITAFSGFVLRLSHLPQTSPDLF
jgi:hypothetical protein